MKRGFKASSSSSLNVLKKGLQDTFGFNDFRTKLQEEAIACAYEGNDDCFVCMPTGAGKSLCYQLPGICEQKKDKLTIVVSPLIALINNQIMQLKQAHIRAETINSSQSKTIQEQIKNVIHSKVNTIRFLYLTPEMMATKHFAYTLDYLHKTKKLARIAIDEAHCVSQWGHDFRPDYLKLGRIKEKYPNIPWIALTATASPKVVEDILNQLKLRTPVKRFMSSPFRDNLYYDILFKDQIKSPIQDLKEFALKMLKSKQIFKKLCMAQHKKTILDYFAPDPVKTGPKPNTSKSSSTIMDLKDVNLFTTAKSLLIIKDNLSSKCSKPTFTSTNTMTTKYSYSGVGLIYCRTRDACEAIATELTKQGLSTIYYHAGLTPSKRIEAQEKWMKNEVACIAATISFGMGVDKPDVRFVVHWNLPQSVTGYYQESGRAGRDGKPSKCRIYYSRKDRNDISFLIQTDIDKAICSKKSTPEKFAKAKEAMKKFERMIDYCESSNKCRHLLLLKEFDATFDDESLKGGCKTACDYCMDPRAVKQRIALYNSDALRTYRGPSTSSTEGFSLPKFDETPSNISEKEDPGESMLSLVQEEFAKRKGISLRKQKSNQMSIQNIKQKKLPSGQQQLQFKSKKSIELLDPDNKRLKDVTLEMRIQYHQKLKADLITHYNRISVHLNGKEKLSTHELSQIGAECELKVYREKGNKLTYKSGIVELIRNINKSNDNLNVNQLIVAFVQRKLIANKTNKVINEEQLTDGVKDDYYDDSIIIDD